MRRALPLCTLTLLTVALAGCASAQSGRTLSADEWCRDGYGGRQAKACEVRETVIRARQLRVDGDPNGGITVRQWDRPDVLVRARVTSWAPSQAEADRLVEATRVETDRGRVRSEAPSTRGTRSGVAVSYEIFAPRRTDLALKAVNGGLTVDGIEGDLDAETVNGGVSLRGVAGDVRARTVNGGVSVDLAGQGWDGAGLDVKTTNGGVSVTLPPGYSARLAAETKMGRVSTSGLALRDERRARGRWTGDRLEATLGRGGARLSVATVNGGVSVRQSR